ncbi:SAG-related sequence SRS47B [Toxoplasma gondii FOU]|uniref:SAG-related sequence SRS47B n=2 Tax=Toxoplasma gondii TaxID=5811 RepID=A0A086JJQ9_TOXGO|nr:SAG-related sequence SRS47B [Toxoplasma gondii FOU]PUA83430.1 SAG-related sequence SRS47B [Toxoplasma gondii TgCATBr9]
MSFMNSRFFQVLGRRPCVVGFAIAAGLVCLSACGTKPVSETVVSCEEAPKFVSLSLPEQNSSLMFKCPDGSSLFPDEKEGTSTQYCKDASCSQTAALIDGLKLQEVQDADVDDAHSEGRATAAQAKAYKLTVETQPEQAHTLYFLCKSTDGTLDESLPAKDARDPHPTSKTTCTFQFPVYSKHTLSDPPAEECKEGQTLEVASDFKPKKVTFRCADNWTLSPANFEKAYKGEACADDSEATLADLGFGAKRVEGKAATLSAKSPAYALEITDFPAGPNNLKLCFKCKRLSDQKQITSEPSEDECRIIVDVAPKKTQPDEEHGEDGPAGDEKPGDESTGQPSTDGDGNEKPSTSGASDHFKHSILISGALLLASVLALRSILA